MFFVKVPASFILELEVEEEGWEVVVRVVEEGLVVSVWRKQEFVS